MQDDYEINTEGASYGYYTTLYINYMDTINEAIIKSGELKYYFLKIGDTTSEGYISLIETSNKDIFKLLLSSKDTLYFDSTNVLYYIDNCKVIPSKFQDSISKLSTEHILKSYFEDRYQLDTDKLSQQQIRAVIYVLAKRREYIFGVYMMGKEELFYGQKLEKYWEKTMRKVYGREHNK